jgi:hypothetical protein
MNQQPAPAIRHYVRLSRGRIVKDGVAATAASSPEEIYQALQHPYIKFFKMDVLCKWAWLGAEYLLGYGDDSLYAGTSKEKTAVAFFTGTGCLDVDQRYRESMAAIPSPALFVYTLPNIMLGEVCIRHGFKGEQICMVQPGPDFNEICFYVSDMLAQTGMEACLCGWADASGSAADVCFFWVTKAPGNTAFTAANMKRLYNW